MKIPKLAEIKKLQTALRILREVGEDATYDDLYEELLDRGISINETASCLDDAIRQILELR
jgi:hypothetical protein